MNNLLASMPFRIACLLILATFAVDASGQTPARPNIIFIMADDLGYSDLGCYGGEIDTPNLDRLASNGLRFTQFYNESKCTQSRAALMTGSTHHRSRNLNDRRIPTIAELMNGAGYRTMMAGKWHLASTPVERGFQRYFGFLNGAVNFWTGEPSGQDKTLKWRLDDRPWHPPEDGFYTTDAFTDKAIEFIDEARREDEPFFLYLAHNAPHYPLHAWPEDIRKYKGKYMKGWDALRQERYERMIRMGLINASTALSGRDPNVPAWDALSGKQKEEYDLLMAVYAAMVDRLDQNIGRLMNALREWNLDRNTLILFCSDNGGCPYQNEEKPGSVPGGPESHRTYNTPWANASNTPFRLYKRFSHEGGISTPMIVHWPAGVSAHGTMTNQQGHLIDILPTCLELAGAEIPEHVAGESLVNAFRGRAFVRERPLFWEYIKHRAVRSGDYKLAGESGKDWALYHIPSDRIESNDLSEKKPAVVDRLAGLYDDWAAKAGAPNGEECRNARVMGMKDYGKALGVTAP